MKSQVNGPDRRFLSILTVCLSIFLIQPAASSEDGPPDDLHVNTDNYDIREKQEVFNFMPTAQAIESSPAKAEDQDLLQGDYDFEFLFSDFLSPEDAIRFLNINRGKVTVLEFETLETTVVRVWYTRICSVRC